MQRTTRPLFVATCLILSGPATAHAQLALAAGANEAGGLSAIVNRALLAAALKPSYQVHLTSDWPQLSAPDGSCLNGGEEFLEGPLELTSGGDYVGTLSRTATIHFCGSHGSARDACILTLRSKGPVVARGEVLPLAAGWADPVVELHWSSAAEGNEVTVDGNCAPSFNEALRRMYLGVTHTIEFPFPTAGEATRREQLDEYGWNVEVE